MHPTGTSLSKHPLLSSSRGKSDSSTNTPQLAEKHSGPARWGYRAVHCGQVDAIGRLSPSNTASKDASTQNDPSDSHSQFLSLQKRTAEATALLRKAGVPSDLDWLDPSSITAYEEMGDPSTTAQVHPYQFTTSMARLSEEEGVNIIYGSATTIHQTGEGDEKAVTGVTYKTKDTGEEKTLEADTVILTAGPWTRNIHPSAPISAMRAHSVTIRPSRPVSAYALFTSIDMPPETKPGRKAKRTETVTPEIYARPNNEVYACGSGDTLVPLPETTALVQCDTSRCDDVVRQVSSISPELRDGEVTARQACYLPNVSTGGGPLIGRTSVKGLLIGAGHTCWGIQNAPGTGRCLSELVWDGAVKSADLRALDPRRFGM